MLEVIYDSTYIYICIYINICNLLEVIYNSIYITICSILEDIYDSIYITTHVQHVSSSI